MLGLKKITNWIIRRTKKNQRQNAIDWLYYCLGGFTHLYVITLAVFFFAAMGSSHPALLGLLEALQDPYLGGLGVYVVLKEIKKHNHQLKIKRHGEYFVAAWIILLLVSTMAVIFSSDYKFDSTYKLIVTNSLATLIIYIGGVISRKF